MTVAAANAAYETARAAYLRAADDLRAAIDAETIELASDLPEEVLAIVRAVAAEFRVEVAELLGRSRRREHTEPRFAVIGLSQERCPHYGQHRLAACFGRDHNMVPHSVAAMTRLIDSDPRYRASIARIRATLDASPS